MICYSIFSKVWLLALVWRRTCSLANRIPMIPVFTCLFCLFLAAFLAEIAQTDMAYFIPSRVLVGLGAVCFTLFSIVSILEAGSAKNNKKASDKALSALSGFIQVNPSGIERILLLILPPNPAHKPMHSTTPTGSYSPQPAGDVHHFADEVQPRHFARFHRP